jgi:histidinol-phosphate aminotransferase
VRQPGDTLNRVIELNRNEIPYSPPQRVLRAAKEGLVHSNTYLKTYELDELRRRLSIYSEVEENSIFVGSGAEALMTETLHLFSRRREVIIVDPTFFMITCVTENLESLGTKVVKVRLTYPHFSLPAELLIEESKAASLTIIDNPNNPSGRLLLNSRSVEALCESTDGIVLVDEGYHEFSQFTVADLVKNYPNLAVARTMSKAFGLAGLKLGYMIAGETVLDLLSSADLPLRPSKPSVYAAIEALKDTGYMKRNVRRIVKERERVRERVDEMGLDVYPSCTNFLLIRTDVPDAARRLEELGVTVFDPSKQLPCEFIRVSVGLKEDDDAFLSALKKIL